MKILSHTILACASLGLFLATPSFAAEKKEMPMGKVTACDKAWAHEAAVSDKMEIALAKTAETKGMSPEVKQHAMKMIEDHGKTTAELKKWAEMNNVDLMAEIPAVKKAAGDEIMAKSGAEFDKAYMNHEVEHHRMAAAHFANGAEFIMNPELKEFAAKNEPTIDEHLSMVEKATGAKMTSGMAGHSMPAGVPAAK